MDRTGYVRARDPWIHGYRLVFGAYLSADGCLVVVSFQAGINYKLYAAVRGMHGRFSGTPIEIDARSYPYPTSPAMTTDLQSLWFVASDGRTIRLRP